MCEGGSFVASIHIGREKTVWRIKEESEERHMGLSSYDDIDSTFLEMMGTTLEIIFGGNRHRNVLWIVVREQSLVLILARVMIRQEVNGWGAGCILTDEFCRALHVLIIGIHTNNQWNAEENGRLSSSISFKGSHEHLNVLQDGFVGHTCETTVRFGIHVLQIYQHQFATTCHTFHHIGVSVKRSIYRAMEASSPEFVEQFANVVGMHQRLSVLPYSIRDRKSRVPS